MGFFDEFLTGVKARRTAARKEMLGVETHVRKIDNKGIQFAEPDRRASTQLAKHAVRETLGYVPDGMNYYVGPENFHPLKKGTGEFLQRAGVKTGTTGTELQSIFDTYDGRMGGERGPQLTQRSPDARTNISSGGARDSGRVATRENAGYRGTTSTSPMPLSTPTSAGYDQARSRGNQSDSYQQGYNGTRDTLLDMNQLDTFINANNDMMRRVLHSALFGEF